VDSLGICNFEFDKSFYMQPKLLDPISTGCMLKRRIKHLTRIFAVIRKLYALMFYHTYRLIVGSRLKIIYLTPEFVELLLFEADPPAVNTKQLFTHKLSTEKFGCCETSTFKTSLRSRSQTLTHPSLLELRMKSKELYPGSRLNPVIQPV
jgi:hypothetical protein